MNSFNLAAVNAIRNTGGNNPTRFIMIPQVGAKSGSAMADLLIPNNDTGIIVSVQNYNPYWFCLDGSGSGTWGTASDISSLEKDIKSISDHFISKGQAVVLEEWGAGDKDNYSEFNIGYTLCGRNASINCNNFTRQL